MSPTRLCVSTLALLGLVACSSVPGLTSPAGSTESASSLTVADQAFVTQAAYGGLGEMALGELAGQKTTNPEVRDLAAMIVDEHTRANEELTALAEAKGMTPPTAPDPGRQAAAVGLGTLSGANFDRQYLQQQLADHEVTIALFESQAEDGSDPDMRAFAEKWLPGIRAHTEMIRTLADQTGASG